MITLICSKCKQETRPRRSELPSDYDEGFFCEHCRERISLEEVLLAVICEVDNEM